MQRAQRQGNRCAPVGKNIHPKVAHRDPASRPRVRPIANAPRPIPTRGSRLPTPLCGKVGAPSPPDRNPEDAAEDVLGSGPTKLTASILTSPSCPTVGNFFQTRMKTVSLLEAGVP